MNKKLKVSVVILTRNRARLLRKNLEALRGQLRKTDEIVVVDNQSRDQSLDVLRYYQNILPLRIFSSRLRGYPQLYNFALGKTKGDVVILLDDDCVAHRDYVFQALEAHYRNPRAVLQGESRSIPKNTVYADISQEHLATWLRAHSKGKNILDTIDNRNLLIPRSVLRKHRGFSESMTAGAEDTEFGYRLDQAGVPILYTPKMLAYHHERTTIRGFLLQHLRIAKTHALFDAEVPRKDRIQAINRYTWKGHLKTAFRLWVLYVRQRRWPDILLLPVMYAGLVLVRLVGYVTGQYFYGKAKEKHRT